MEVYYHGLNCKWKPLGIFPLGSFSAVLEGLLKDSSSPGKSNSALLSLSMWASLPTHSSKVPGSILGSGYRMSVWFCMLVSVGFLRILWFSSTFSKMQVGRLAMLNCTKVLSPGTQHSCDWLWIHHDPNQNKAVTKNEWMIPSICPPVILYIKGHWKAGANSSDLGQKVGHTLGRSPVKHRDEQSFPTMGNLE